MAVTPRRDLFGQVLPTVDANEMYDVYYPRANAALGAALVDPAWWGSTAAYQYSRVGKKHAERSSFPWRFVPTVYDWNYMKAEAAGTVPKSALAGEVLYGNNAGKKSLQQTYLARRQGDRPGQHLAAAPGGLGAARVPAARYAVHLEVLGTAGTVTATKEVTADKVFFAAGSVGTSKLLTKLKATGVLPLLNAEVGKGWGDNGNVMCGRANHMWDPTGSLQSTIPTIGIDNWDAGGAFAEVAPLPVGHRDLRVDVPVDHQEAEPRPVHLEPDQREGRPELAAGWKQTSINAAKSIFDKINSKEGDDLPHRPLRRLQDLERHADLSPARRRGARQGHRQLRPAARLLGAVRHRRRADPRRGHASTRS